MLTPASRMGEEEAQLVRGAIVITMHNNMPWDEAKR
jgi:hypothetical protein